MKRLKLRSFSFLVVGALLATAVAGCAETAEAPGSSGKPTITPSDETANVGVPLQDGDSMITLRGHLFGGQNETVVILSHMRPNDQTAWFDFAEELADAGYAAFTFDFRGYGETGGEKDFKKLDEDLKAIVNYIRQTGKEQIFLVGASMGGTASLVVAAEDDFAGVVAVSPPARFESQDALSAVAEITEPILLIGSENDTQASGFDDLVAAAGDSSETEIYEGDAHGTDLLQSEHSAAFRERVLQFLEDHS